MKPKVFALVDCNNFYASCEKVFNPSLNHRPVVVLSNNDGCIIARSQEAKALGIPMGSPYYQNKALMDKHKVAVFSSNYQLYGDMSHRVMEALRMLVPDLEVYSIDEAFVRLDKLCIDDLWGYGVQMRNKILQWTGIPTSIGIAPTKTLAKIANHVAKKKTAEGVFDLRDPEIQTDLMADLPLEELWGISHRLAQRFHKLGIRNALQLRESSPHFIRKHFSVVMERMVYELRGLSCLDLETMSPKKNIMSSKSFGKPLTHLQSIQEALSHYTARACEKLRKQQSKTQGISVFLKTNPFRDNEPQYHNGASIGFDSPSSDTREIIHSAKKLMKNIYRSGYRYHKCGIMLMDIVPETHQQGHLWAKSTSEQSQRVMNIMDSLNHKMGAGSLFCAAQGTQRDWQMRSDRRSPRYTTQWGELAWVY